MIRTKSRNAGERSLELTPASKMTQLAAKAFWKIAPGFPEAGRYNISICEEKKFIWYRVAKVGTRSMFDLFDAAGLELESDHAMFCYYSPAQYTEYFKFAFVRNPYDRFLSGWRNKIVEQNYFHLDENLRAELADFERFIDWFVKTPRARRDHHFAPQTTLIDLRHVDFVGRFERFAEGFDFVAERLGLQDHRLPHLNSTKSGAGYAEQYSDRAREIVREFYARDLTVFDYAFGA